MWIGTDCRFQDFQAGQAPTGGYNGLTNMGYFLIIWFASIALAAVYVFASEASLWSKVAVVAVLLVSFAWRYGFVLQAFLAISLALYFTYLKARSTR